MGGGVEQDNLYVEFGPKEDAVKEERVRAVELGGGHPDRTLIRDTALSCRMSTGREIRLVEEDDGWWSAIDRETGVASQGETRQKALQNLDEAIEVTEEARADDTSAPEPDAPWFEDS